jgi:hypothetical protein
VPQHVARLVTWLLTSLVVDYFASRRLVVDYFAYVARPDASARRASGCLGTSSGSSSTTLPRAGSSSTTSPMPHVRVPRHVSQLVTRLVVDYFASRRLVVDYFDYAARPVASARHAARRAARHATRRRLLHLAQARRRLLHLRHASGCLGTSRGSSRRSPPTTSPTPRVRVPPHVARLVTRLVIDYSVHCDFVLRPHWLYFSHVVRRGYLFRGNTGSTSSTPRVAAMSSSGRITSTIHLD